MNDSVQRLSDALSDQYKIEHKLGQGGMATVYEAEDLKHHRKVALKVLKPDLAAVLGTDRFLREIGVAASLNHPNILPLLDSGEADGTLYFTMPLVTGPSLAQRIRDAGPLGIDEIRALVTDVAAALFPAGRLASVSNRRGNGRLSELTLRGFAIHKANRAFMQSS